MSEPVRAVAGSVPAPVSVVVLAFNEARNIEACLRSVVGWTTDVFVVDSGSSDGTRALAESCGATVFSHPFETHARQWNWALANLPLRTEWVLALDADQRVTSELRASLHAAASREGNGAVAGLYVNRRQIFRGRWIRHGGYYPKYLLKMFRRNVVTIDERDLVDHHFTVSGPTEKLRGDLVEDNLNEAAISVWTDKHNRYAVLQARQDVETPAAAPLGLSAVFGSPDLRVSWMKQQWARLPLFVRPCLYVFYRYVLRLGFLDGREGFIFHVLQGFWYRLLVDINIAEVRSQSADARAASANIAERMK